MVTPSPLSFPCPHLPTGQESRRDPAYLGCGATAGEPCRWARRYDKETDPPFHSERLEAVNANAISVTPVPAEDFRELILRTGLI